MTADEFCTRLRALHLGETETLSWPQFFGLFKEGQTEQHQKLTAVELGEACGCGVFFLRGYEQFVRFTRKQTRASVQVGRQRAPARASQRLMPLTR